MWWVWLLPCHMNGLDGTECLIDFDLELLKKGIAVRTFGELERPLLFLEQLCPTSIILYDIDLAFIRTIEVIRDHESCLL